jgi:hypothetical protein
MGKFAPCSITREQYTRHEPVQQVQSFPAGFLARILPQGPFPSLKDSGTIAFRTCPLKRTSDAHSGATATDFHRVPVLLIRPGIGPNRKAFYSVSQRATTL